MKVADKIREARIQKGYSQQQAADSLYVSRQTVSNWENDKSLPDIVSILKMSELYDVSLDILLKGDVKLMEKIERDVSMTKAEKQVMRYGWFCVGIGIGMIILGKIFDGTVVIDFINGALPWILLSLLFLYIFVYLKKVEEGK